MSRSFIEQLFARQTQPLLYGRHKLCKQGSPDRRLQVSAVAIRISARRHQNEFPIGNTVDYLRRKSEIGRKYLIVCKIDSEQSSLNLFQIIQRIIVYSRLESVELIIGIAPPCLLN